MKRILFMPLLQIPSGHHHVADCIQEELNRNMRDIQCEKLEMLSHCFGPLENVVSSVYLQWIHSFPNLYSSVYKRMAGTGKKRKHYSLYKALFMKKIYHAINELNPDIIICTHALPSFLLDEIKRQKRWSGILINVYTDFFINDLWAIKYVDYHFVPSQAGKEKLIQQKVRENQIYITGIPIHPVFKTLPSNSTQKMILISGGNMGTGSIRTFLQRIKPTGKIIYKVLCGKNVKLYQYVTEMNNKYIIPIPYITSKVEMNYLYEEATAIITKPGGVTVSECLWKRLPIIIYEALPGQEEFNLNFLKKEGFVLRLEDWKRNKNLEPIILELLNKHTPSLHSRFQSFHRFIEYHNITDIMKENIF